MKKDDTEKKIGVVKINLADYIDKSAGQIKRKVLLEKCPDKTAYIEFTLKSTPLSSGNGTDTVSMMSYDVSVDSGPEEEYNFEDLDKNDKPLRNRPSSAVRLSLGNV